MVRKYIPKTVPLLVLALITLVLSSLVGCGPSAPQAQFSATPTIGYAPIEVQFTDLSTGNVSSWEWDFDTDGTVDSTLQNPQYTYDNVGNYTVSLTVSGTGGNDTEVKTDYIEVIPCPRFADFIAEPTVGEGVTKVQFTDKSTGNVTSWAWDFQNDGSVDSTVQNPTYTYRKNGVYSVKLTITTPECTDTAIKKDYISITGCST